MMRIRKVSHLSRKTVGLLLVIVVLGVSLAYALSLLTSRQFRGRIIAYGSLELYSNPECTILLPQQVDLGDFIFPTTKEVEFYMKSTTNIPLNVTWTIASFSPYLQGLSDGKVYANMNIEDLAWLPSPINATVLAFSISKIDLDVSVLPEATPQDFSFDMAIVGNDA